MDACEFGSLKNSKIFWLLSLTTADHSAFWFLAEILHRMPFMMLHSP